MKSYKDTVSSDSTTSKPTQNHALRTSPSKTRRVDTKSDKDNNNIYQPESFSNGKNKRKHDNLNNESVGQCIVEDANAPPNSQKKRRIKVIDLVDSDTDGNESEQEPKQSVVVVASGDNENINTGVNNIGSFQLIELYGKTSFVFVNMGSLKTVVAKNNTASDMLSSNGAHHSPTHPTTKQPNGHKASDTQKIHYHPYTMCGKNFVANGIKVGNNTQSEHILSPEFRRELCQDLKKKNPVGSPLTSKADLDSFDTSQLIWIFCNNGYRIDFNEERGRKLYEHPNYNYIHENCLLCACPTRTINLLTMGVRMVYHHPTVVDENSISLCSLNCRLDHHMWEELERGKLPERRPIYLSKKSITEGTNLVISSSLLSSPSVTPRSSLSNSNHFSNNLELQNLPIDKITTKIDKEHKHVPSRKVNTKSPTIGTDFQDNTIYGVDLEKGPFFTANVKLYTLCGGPQFFRAISLSVNSFMENPISFVNDNGLYYSTTPDKPNKEFNPIGFSSAFIGYYQQAMNDSSAPYLKTRLCCPGCGKVRNHPSKQPSKNNSQYNKNKSELRDSENTNEDCKRQYVQHVYSGKCHDLNRCITRIQIFSMRRLMPYYIRDSLIHEELGFKLEELWKLFIEDLFSIDFTSKAKEELLQFENLVFDWEYK